MIAEWETATPAAPMPESGDAQADFKNARRKKATLADPSTGSKLPPHSTEAEQGVLGCILLSPKDCLTLCIEKFKQGESEVFYDLRHRAVYEVLIEMFAEAAPIDLITIQQKLKDRNQLESVGGLAYLASLPDAVPSAANLEYYTVIVAAKYILRQMIGTCTEVVSRAYEHQGEVDQLLHEAVRDVLRLAQPNISTSLPIKKAVQFAITQIETRHQNQGKLAGVPSGFVDLDYMTCGFTPGDMIVIAARPSMGKTSWGMNVVEHVACDQNLPVGVFSLEMSQQSLVMRLLCAAGRVDSRSIRDGNLTEGDFNKLGLASLRISKAPIFIDDTPSLSMLHLGAKARALKQVHDIKLFVIDYLQLLKGSSRRYDNRQAEVTDISGGIKALAKELGVPFIVLAQLNRELENAKRAPRSSDLRESGAIEQDADLIGLLYSEDEEAKQKSVISASLLIDKSRNGPTGKVNLTFFKSMTRFESASKVSDNAGEEN